eukprot:Rhum_TRINITY_DN14530_c9_g2::Rhum_TRINITY_DN14530_c9_g2_i5::g.95227::m.95227/K10411/DNAL1; dynein light chain 1, axonemal
MAMPPISVKEAIENWLDVQWEKNKKTVQDKADRKGEEYVAPPRPVAAEETDVRLFAGGNGKLPPIQRMDKELQTLKKCQILRLSTNCIDKIGPGLNALPNLEILSLGRNKIKVRRKPVSPPPSPTPSPSLLPTHPSAETGEPRPTKPQRAVVCHTSLPSRYLRRSTVNVLPPPLSLSLSLVIK